MRPDKPIIIATENLRDAIALRDTYKKITSMELTVSDFGHLRFKLSAALLRPAEVEELIEKINSLSESFCVYIETDFTIEFDYYINASAVPIVRAIIDDYLMYAPIIYWEYDEF